MRWPWSKRVEQAVQPRGATKAVLGENDVLARMLSILGQSDVNTPNAALELYEQSTAVSIPIDWVADPMADIDPVLEKDGDFDTVHPVLELLRAPSPDYTGRLFRDAIAHDYLITGECFIAAIGSPEGPPLEIQPLSPTAMAPYTEGGTGLVSQWEVTGETLKGKYRRIIQPKKRARYINKERFPGVEVRQIRRYSTTNHSLVRAQSPLMSASREARQHLLGLMHNSSLLSSGGRGSLLFKYRQHFSDEDWNELMRRLRSNYGGAANAGKIMVETADELEVSELGQKNKDMDFANLQDQAKRSVALRYKVPLPLVTTDASTFSNFEASILALYDYAVLPTYRRVFDGISDFLLPRYGIDPSQYRISYDPNQITALMSRRLDEIVKKAGLHVLTGNEIRGDLGRDPEVGFDEILIPANLMPLGSELFAAPGTPPTEVVL